MQVQNSVIVITGAARGLGLEMARSLTQAGASVYGIDCDASGIIAAAEISGATMIEGDVSDPDQCARLIAEISKQAGPINVLINNAAVLKDQTLASRLGGKVRTHSIDDWSATLATNLTGTFLMAREVAASMIGARQGGLLLNMSSISRGGNAGQSAYAATKAAVVALTKTWAQELAIYKIRSVAIAPGFIQTPMTDRIPPMFVEKIRERTPVGRFGTPEEFAMTARFVIENDYLNGTVVEVDGGMSF